jgi:hypothetical protein
VRPIVFKLFAIVAASLIVAAAGCDSQDRNGAPVTQTPASDPGSSVQKDVNGKSPVAPK